MFAVKVIKRSNSNRVYLFEDADNRQPQPGHLMLLKREDEPIMAFRILKSYPGEKKVAAKRIKRYRRHRILENDSSYMALEKISDVVPGNTEQDNEDLKELESNNIKEKLKIKAYDPELDSPTTPHAKDDFDEDSNDPGDEQLDSHLAITVEEVNVLDHHRHWLTAGFGFIRNNGPPSKGGSFLFSSGNIRYGFTLSNMVFFDRSHVQDSFTLEGGFYLYKTIGYVSQADAYTVLTLSGALRYNVLFSESLGIFFYTGILQSNVIGAAQPSSDGVSALSSILPALGGGFLFEVGPSWYTRVDVGIDSVTLNLILRF